MISEYRTQTYFAVIQAAIIIFGGLVIAMILKDKGDPDRFRHLPFRLALVRNWGVLLLVIPLTWSLYDQIGTVPSSLVFQALDFYFWFGPFTGTRIFSPHDNGGGALFHGQNLFVIIKIPGR